MTRAKWNRGTNRADEGQPFQAHVTPESLTYKMYQSALPLS